MNTDPPKPADPDLKLDLPDPWDNPASWLMTMPVQRMSQSEGTITQVAGRMPVQSLARTQMLHIERPHGETIRCATGRLWLKHQGDPEERVIEGGQTFHAGLPGRLTIMALVESTFGIDLAKPAEPPAA